MRRSFLAVITISLMIGAVAGTAVAAPSFLGTTGNILTPDDVLLAPGAFSANFHSLDIDDLDSTVTFLGATVGVTPTLELGVGRFDPEDGDSEIIVNGKYQLLAETASRPSLVFGAVDLSGGIDPDDDASLYVLVGKNLTPVATEVAGEPSKPLRGTLGIGTGIYDGVFLSLDWTMSPRLSLMAEFISGAEITGVVGDDSIFNAGVRFALTNELRGDLALINGEDFGFGISYTRVGL